MHFLFGWMDGWMDGCCCLWMNSFQETLNGVRGPQGMRILFIRNKKKSLVGDEMHALFGWMGLL